MMGDGFSSVQGGHDVFAVVADLIVKNDLRAQ